jgi:methylenetetrahydrofolate reductase (NADPH)
VTKLLLPYEPDEVVDQLAAHKAAHPEFGIEQVHIFPLGGIATAATWANTRTGQAPALAANG